MRNNWTILRHSVFLIVTLFSFLSRCSYLEMNRHRRGRYSTTPGISGPLDIRYGIGCCRVPEADATGREKIEDAKSWAGGNAWQRQRKQNGERKLDLTLGVDISSQQHSKSGNCLVAVRGIEPRFDG